MHDWLGLALIALGLGLTATAFIKRRNRILHPWPAGSIRPEFAAMGEIVRPLVLGFVGIFAAKMSFYYFVMGGNELLTALEFAAMMFVLAAYCGYLVAATTKTKVAAPAVVEEPTAGNIRSVA
jgi:hypothetical protein